ncbi:peptidoglycan glycosyltransferase FtsI [Catenovulum sp. SM1970]|uniref:penicillin-binding transpeptidase domain-containing protein n=1 Tax=Marinifaba aquimaris TaxID=2741323 RepID=UPI0015720470|nr:penicillin-binding transpeptidase domain-containing protein [Marinifaba aquimaris]NTS76593.1 peptidoglycan glycosyltransferase FtsI [Marinifaba aquimaris]
MNKRNAKQKKQISNWRFYTVFAAVALVFTGLAFRAAYIQVIDPEMLREQGDRRTHRFLANQVHRGMIKDRNGLELAISAPVNTVWADPKVIGQHQGLEKTRQWRALSEVLNKPHDKLLAKVETAIEKQRRFIYLGRHIPPSMAEYVEQLDIPGVYTRAESKRYYPYGEVSAHLVGFTNVDDDGIEGIEKQFNEALTGEAGKRHVLKDARGRVIKVLDEEESKPAKDVYLSIDQGIQALAYQELKKAVKYHGADSGSLVMIDVTSGEILALVNSPSFNPNNRSTLTSRNSRNRAVTDNFEPGSSIKPLVVLSALEFGSIAATDMVDTAPGWMQIGGRRVRDSKNYGEMDLVSILQKSSNVGVTKLALSMPVEHYLDAYYNAGFGSDTGSMILGESAGVFYDRRRWSDFELATLSFGYGLSVTPLQIAHFYATIAAGGIQRPLSILKLDKPNEGERRFSATASNQVLKMMEKVTQEGGTGIKAAVKGFRIAGKTGTSRKAVAGGYGHDYYATFAGVAPMSSPKIATVVVINDPKGDEYHGGDVAAPVFSKVVSGALRILNQNPDQLPEKTLEIAQHQEGTPSV